MYHSDRMQRKHSGSNRPFKLNGIHQSSYVLPSRKQLYIVVQESCKDLRLQ